MGCGSSKHVIEETIRLPADDTPYPGPSVTHKFVEVIVNFDFKGKTVFCDAEKSFPQLEGVYSDPGFKLRQLLQVPGEYSMGVMSRAKSTQKYQAIISRVNSEDRSAWRLQVERCLTQPAEIGTGTLPTTGMAPPGAPDLIQKVCELSARGGRLECLPATGPAQYKKGAMSNLGHQKDVKQEVDAMFSMPRDPGSSQFVYEVVNQPVAQQGYRNMSGAGIKVTADWEGPFRSYLAQGWRLVDIYLDYPTQALAGVGITPENQFSFLWFFEKDVDRVDDATPCYEGWIIDYTQHASLSGFGKTSAQGGWTPTILEMGNRGWELAAAVTSPEMTGFGQSFQMRVKLYFQRKLQNFA